MEKPKYLEIKTKESLGEELQKAREIVLFSHYNSNLEIIEFEEGKIKYFDRQNDKNFTQKLALWLKDNTGKNWTLERVENATGEQTISEHKKAEVAADPMVASAMDLFDDAEIVNISK